MVKHGLSYIGPLKSSYQPIISLGYFGRLLLPALLDLIRLYYNLLTDMHESSNQSRNLDPLMHFVHESQGTNF